MRPSIQMPRILGALAVAAFAAGASAGGCGVSSQIPAPVVAQGYRARLVGTGFSYPRGVMFDSSGKLLVIDRGTGLVRLTLTEKGECITVGKKEVLIDDKDLNHGLELSKDGKTVYASTTDEVYSWDYDTDSSSPSNKKTLVTGMNNEDHTTRTLMLNRKGKANTLVVSRGSMANIDPLANDISTGHAQVKSFNLDDLEEGSVDFTEEGEILGWGLRNSVGVGQHPMTGGIWTVENSVDELSRNGKNIHQDNPGEEMNFLGYLSGKDSPNKGGYFGYPQCFAAWAVKDIPKHKGLQVGSPFAIGKINSTHNDALCKKNSIGPRLTFQAHMAPLDIKFNKQGTTAYVTFHGSWDRDIPVGYKLTMIKFTNGEPTEPSTSTSAAIDIVTNQNPTTCADNDAKCFRPVGLAWDPKGRLFMTSDVTGEIYVVDMPGTTTTGASPTRRSATAEPTGNGGNSRASMLDQASAALMIAMLAVCAFW